mmetsp:Transcript_4798/g.9568  ORF Transcript_4798/g.9568 Transcript_4798/m.9568 type:complete len:232 (-) Transcript_4798:137-832(-)
MSFEGLESHAALLLGLSEWAPEPPVKKERVVEHTLNHAPRRRSRRSLQSDDHKTPIANDSIKYSSAADVKDSAPEVEFNRTPFEASIPRLDAPKKKPRIINRASRACSECHRRKVRCLPNAEGNKRPCQACIRSGVPEMCRDHVPTLRGQRSIDGNEGEDHIPRLPKAPKALADHLNKHRGIPCMRNSWCNRPYKHPGHCKNPNAPKRMRKRSRPSPPTLEPHAGKIPEQS